MGSISGVLGPHWYDGSSKEYGGFSGELSSEKRGGILIMEAGTLGVWHWYLFDGSAWHIK